MTEDEARALVAALRSEFTFPTTDSWVLSRRAAVESYTASRNDDGSWRVTLLWQQGEHGFGSAVDDLADAVVYGPVTPEQAAVDLRMFYLEEPHSTAGDAAEFGRLWLRG